VEILSLTIDTTAISNIFWDNYGLIPTQHNESSCVAPVGDFTSGRQGGGAGYHEIRHTMSEDTTVFLKQQEEG
jgi:hypothetical protein